MGVALITIGLGLCWGYVRRGRQRVRVDVRPAPVVVRTGAEGRFFVDPNPRRHRRFGR